MRSDTLVACICNGLYGSAEPLPIGFTIPHTRLVHDHLRPLSCQRLGPPATHHMNQSTLCESDGFIRVSECSLT